MTVPRAPLALLAASLALVACTGSTPRPHASGAKTPPPTATLLARNVRLLAGDDRAVRIGFDPANDAAKLNLRFVPENGRVTLCPLPAVGAPLPPPAACKRDVFAGVRQELQTKGMRAIAFVLARGEVLFDLTLEYDEAGSSVSVRLPTLRAPAGASVCKDNGCNPFFELRPPRAGRFTARARWAGPRATLVLLQGSVLGRSLTATGIPYAEPARSDGTSPLSVATSMSAPGEYALALRQEAGPGASDLSGIAIDATWPRA